MLQLNVRIALALCCFLCVYSKKVTFDEIDTDRTGTITRIEWEEKVVPHLSNEYTPSDAVESISGSLNRLMHPTLEEPLGEDLSFGSAFFNSWSLIIATELGDKTFFIAAILCLKFSRLPVFLGALSALIIMTGLSAVMGVVLPAIMSRKYTHFLASLLFFYFGLKLLYESRDMEPGVVSDELAEVEEELGHGKKDDSSNSHNATVSQGSAPLSPSASSLSFERIFTQSLTLTFLAEWGDRSQIATVALASHKEFFGVVLGGCIGHGMCTGLACVGGKMLATKISEKSATTFGGAVFLIFGVHSLFFEDV
mmetsp:Transcript_23856/g.49699  ORF Transcript_23856/g.49699 Transcript_23856/m.49699 type:complete len:310 (+) Transcript_23856:151-1080(+)|eukprot:CAMPEP_0118652066 /NCGR_PEP_ID=MMETSP0785-20121206/11118_1 /TAXON_ID=91992 /ORGANISM="Bolidomonas pacifica, Strain CCMP 1866" /LENGTH=309 /DNA_ID=CAMNT_0006544555 /DNA_START=113 /DNA_END=1042 /DNA_ORIENTATION=-